MKIEMFSSLLSFSKFCYKCLRKHRKYCHQTWELGRLNNSAFNLVFNFKPFFPSNMQSLLQSFLHINWWVLLLIVHKDHWSKSARSFSDAKTEDNAKKNRSIVFCYLIWRRKKHSEVQNSNRVRNEGEKKSSYKSFLILDIKFLLVWY